jgi:hypothetical protein
MANKYTLGILSSFPQTKFEFSTKEVQLNEIKCTPINSISKENIELTTYTITNPINITPNVDESTGENSFNLQETSYGYIQQTWNMSDSVIKYYTLPSKMELDAGSDYNPVIIPIKPETISTFIIDDNSFGINFGVVPFDEIIIDIPVVPPVFKYETVPVLAFTMGKNIEFFEDVIKANTSSLDSFSAYWSVSGYFSEQAAADYKVLEFSNSGTEFVTSEYAELEQKYSHSFVFQGWKTVSSSWVQIDYLSGSTFEDNELRDMLIVDIPTLTLSTVLPSKWVLTTYRNAKSSMNSVGKYVGAVKHYDTPYKYGRYDFLNQPSTSAGLLDNSILLRLNKEESYLHTPNDNRINLIVPPEKITWNISGFAGFGKYDTNWEGLTPDGTIDMSFPFHEFYTGNTTNIHPDESNFQISYTSYPFNASPGYFEYDENNNVIPDYSKFKTAVTLFYHVRTVRFTQ